MGHYELARKPAQHFKEIIFRQEIIDKILPGITKLTEAVASTLGPNGKNVIVKLNLGNVYTKDGVTVAKNTDFNDEYESLGAELIKEVAKNTCDEVGDGTTLSTILVNALITKGLKEIEKGRRVDDLAKEIKDGVSVVIEQLNLQAKKITTPEETVNVATISANDQELGKLIGDIYNKIGEDGVIITEDSGTLDTFEEEVEGSRFETGLISPYFVTNFERQRCELENPYIFISDLELSSFAPFVQLLQKLTVDNNNNIISFVVIADKVSGEALNGFTVNHVKGKIKCALIEAPYNKHDKKKFLDDLALLTGGTFISRDLNLKIAELDSSYLGRAEKVLATKNNTIIVGGSGEREKIDNRITMLLEESKTSQDKKNLELRISKLKNKISILKVGGNTKSEIREKKYRIEDAVEATKVALKGGIVIGGEIALINASRFLADGIVKESCVEPFKRLLKNIDREQDFTNLIEKVGNNLGFNAATEQVEDLVDKGVIDPALVPITALRNASSVAINFLKTDSIVFNIRDLDEPMGKDDAFHID